MATRKQSYYELLKDPRWQRKRLEILEASDWTCGDCGSETNTLHVHHTYYEKGVMPWEYPDQSLLVLCEDCHVNAQEEMVQLHRAIGRMNGTGCTTAEIIGFIDGQSMLDDEDLEVELFQFEHAAGIGRAFGIEAEPIIGLAGSKRFVTGRAILNKMVAGIPEKYLRVNRLIEQHKRDIKRAAEQPIATNDDPWEVE